MKILIDGSSLLKSLTGVGYYTSQFAKNLIGSGNDVTFHYTWFWSSKLRDKPSKSYSKFVDLVKEYIPKPYLLVRWIRAIAFNLQIVIEEPDLIFEPNYISPPIIGVIPTVVTVHDLSHVRFPEFHPEGRVQYLNRFLVQNLMNAKRIIAVSEFTKRELIDLKIVTEEKIEVIYNGVSHEFRPYPEREVEKTLSDYNLKFKEFILTIGTLEPRKNFLTLLEAYEKLLKKGYNIPKLIVVGIRGWNLERIEGSLKRAMNNQQIEFLGYVDDDALRHIYAAAKFFIFPSYYEGFGLPPLEAMASGTPVISSNTSSLPEVVGEAGILVDPGNPEELCQSMEMLNEDSSLRAVLIEKGLEQSKKFSWEKSADKLNSLFREVSEQG